MSNLSLYSSVDSLSLSSFSPFTHMEVSGD
jgi:hypothetical protein